jgi:hypothetical protein
MPGYVPSPEEHAIQWSQNISHAAKSAPVRAVATAAVTGFGPQLEGGVWSFNTGLQFTTAADGTDADILAVATGVLTFMAAVGTATPVLALHLTGLDDAALLAVGMPPWLTPPRTVLYRGVDPAAVRAAVQALLADPQRLAEANKTYQRIAGGGAVTAAVLAEQFVQNPQRLGDGIPVIGGEAIGQGTAGAIARTFDLLFAEQGVSVLVSRNPSYYFNFWRLGGLIDLSAHPLGTLIMRIDQGFEASGVLRFVSRAAGNDTNAPFTDPALPARTLGAAIAIAGDGDTIMILDSSTYKEAEHVITKAINITSAVSLAADQRHLGGVASSATAPVVPAGMPILEGPQNYGAIRQDMTNDTAVVPTAGAHRVIRFTVPAGTASVTKVVIRYGGAREGGGVYVFRSAGVVIASCHIHRNIGFFNQGPTTIGALLPNPFPGSGWFEEGSGGGLSLYRSSGMIWGNFIERNLALYGAAIGIFASSYPLIAENFISRNRGPDWFVGATVSDGGAIRVLQQSLRYDSQAALQTAVPPGSAISRHLLTIAEMYDTEEVAVTQRSWIHLRANRFDTNIAQDDGGAVYATALTRIFSIGNHLIGNTARKGDGGGFRISTASVLRSIADVISQNRVEGTVAKGATGAGIACRCSSLYILGTVIDGNRSHFAGAGISFTSTREGDVSDGGTARVLGYAIPSWDEQRRLGLGFTSAELMIEGTTLVTNNVADDTTSGKGGGLYAFRFQDGNTFTADPINVQIDSPSTVLDPSNDAGFAQGVDRPNRRFYLVDQTKNGTGGNPPLMLQDADLTGNPPTLSHVST